MFSGNIQLEKLEIFLPISLNHSGLSDGAKASKFLSYNFHNTTLKVNSNLELQKISLKYPIHNSSFTEIQLFKFEYFKSCIVYKTKQEIFNHNN